MIRLLVTLVTVLFLASNLSAKELKTAPGGYAVDLAKYDFIDSTSNVIQYPAGSKSFEPLFNKLDTLVFENRGQVRILHIGGSHLQADVISGRIREHLVKEYPGASAGRGFVFPFSAAKTNTPSSYATSYKGIWDKCKNVQKQVTKPLGLLGIAVSTSDPRAEISILLDKYNSEPMWGETKLRLFGYSDNNDVVPVLRVDAQDIYGILDTASQSYTFTAPRPIDSIQIQFRWMDSLEQAAVAQFIADSLLQDSIAKADTTKKDSAITDAAGSTDTVAKDSIEKADLPNNVALLADASNEAARDSMFQGDCDVLDTACLSQDERAGLAAQAADSTAADSTDSNALQKKRGRPHFTLTGILTETDNPGITYTAVGINGAKVNDYFEEICPRFEKEMEFYKPDLVIFAIGINDANVEKFDDKQFIENYSHLISRIHNVAPNAAIIFETNNDMYRKAKKKKYVQHPNGEIARKAFFTLAEKHKAGVWDKFGIMGGLGSMAKWEKAGLAKSDKVHFKLSGYNLLGDMFYKALISSYTDHIANLPAQEPTELKPAPAKMDSAAKH